VNADRFAGILGPERSSAHLQWIQFGAILRNLSDDLQDALDPQTEFATRVASRSLATSITASRAVVDPKCRSPMVGRFPGPAALDSPPVMPEI